MTQIVFIEGVSGVGKSTTAGKLADDLRARGYRVRSYLEFDLNPIDFYCTAYLTTSEYQQLCETFAESAARIREYTIDAGKARLVRYYDGDTPLFTEPLLGILREHEFCWNPKNPVSLADYTEAYFEVWKSYVDGLDTSLDFIIFDGSLLHHPINDMMRNYQVSGEYAAKHVRTLLEALGNIPKAVFYLKTDDIAAQLRRAHIDRAENPPTDTDIRFWETRYQNDMYVIGAIDMPCTVLNVSNGEWDAARERILNMLLS